MKSSLIRNALGVVISGALLLSLASPVAAHARVSDPVGRWASTPEAANTRTATTDAALPLSWSDCADVTAGAQCASLPVAVDWSRPAGARLGLRLARLSATDPAHRIGVLLLLPGGPGQSGLQALQYGVAENLSADVRARFDVVTLDPRGAGSSAPLDCPPVVASTDPVPSDQASLDRLAATRQQRWSVCATGSKGLSAHMDSLSAARDVEAIRVALGESRISLLGWSYGTLTAQAYAELHGERIRSMLLSSVVDHTRSQAEQAGDQGASTRGLYEYFASWAATNSTSALRGADVRSELLDLMRRADTHPVPAGSKAAISGDDIRGLIVSAAYSNQSPRLWPPLTSALAQAIGGNGTALRQLLDQGGVIDLGVTGPWATFCNDYPVISRSYPEVLAAIGRSEAQVGPWASPHLDIAAITPCQGWPTSAAYPPHRLRPSGPPALLVNAVHDPATAYSGARRVAAQLPGSALLTVDGAGHAILNGLCQPYLTRYLLDGTLPAARTHCSVTVD